MYPLTKHITIPYHLLQTKIEQIENKVVSVSTDNQLSNQFAKGLIEQKSVTVVSFIWDGRLYDILEE